MLGIIRTDEIPDPRDVVIIALADPCAILDAILSMDEMLATARGRKDAPRKRIYDLRADGSVPA